MENSSGSNLNSKRSGARALPSFAIVIASLAGNPILAADPAQASKYTGPGSCSSPACHGGVQARGETSVPQNEYSTWVVRDQHAKAYTVLTNPVGTRMAKILGLPKPDTAPCFATGTAAQAPEEPGSQPNRRLTVGRSHLGDCVWIRGV